MAEQIDVENAIVGLLTGVIYPNGSGAGQQPAQGIPAQIFPGWPVASKLDKLMAEQTACVWVYARPEVREATRYPFTWQQQSVTAATITATVAGNTVTLGGAMPSPFSTHNIFVLLDGQAFSYSVQPSDTLATIAAALSSLIAVSFPGTSSAGAVITIPAGPIPVARVGTVGTSILEVGRFEQAFQIVIAGWTPAVRVALSRAIMPVLMSTNFLAMPDGMQARLIVRSPVDIDAGQKVQIYRRDIKVTVEYAVTQVQTTATVEAVQVSFPGSNIPPRSF